MTVATTAMDVAMTVYLFTEAVRSMEVEVVIFYPNMQGRKSTRNRVDFTNVYRYSKINDSHRLPESKNAVYLNYGISL